MAWITEAGWATKLVKHQTIQDKFKAEILLHPPDNRPIDLDNRVKVILDLAERMKLIKNDKFCRRLEVGYDQSLAKGSARLILSAM